MKSQDDFLTQVCPTEIPYWDKNYGTIFDGRPFNNLQYFHFSNPKFSLKLQKTFEYYLQW